MLLTDYEIENDIIISPGKFEGQHKAVIFVYNWYMDGDFGDELGDNIHAYTINEFEAMDIGLPKARRVMLTIDEQGFVSLDVLQTV